MEEYDGGGVTSSSQNVTDPAVKTCQWINWILEQRGQAILYYPFWQRKCHGWELFENLSKSINILAILEFILIVMVFDMDTNHSFLQGLRKSDEYNVFFHILSFGVISSSPWYLTLLCCPCPSKVEALFEYVSINSCLMSHAFKSACTFFQSIVSDSDPQEEQNFFRHACHSYLWDNVAETWRVILIFAK